MSTYLPRIVDDELEELMADLPAIAMEGAKGVGETATARRRTRTTILLDRPSVPGSKPTRSEWRSTRPLRILAARPATLAQVRRGAVT